MVSNFFARAGGSSSGPIDAGKWQEAIEGVAAVRIESNAAGSSPMDIGVAPIPPDVGSAGISVDDPVCYFDQDVEWTKQDEAMFHHLVKRKALDQITAAEKLELQQLQLQRRSFHHPRSADEVEYEYQRRMATAKLVTAFQEYVRVFSVPHKAWSTSQEEVKAL